MRFIETLKERDWKIKILLLSVPVILLVYIYHGMDEAFARYFSHLSSLYYFDIYRYVYQFLTTLVLFFLFPLIIIKLVFKEKLKNYGLTLGDKRYGLRFIIITIPLIVTPIIILGSHMPQVRAEYPLSKLVQDNASVFLLYEFSYVLLYYVGWEFFFRGYMLFGLREKFGDAYAILLQVIPSALLHFNKPESEFLGSIVLGIVLGYLALRTRSILYPLIIHSCIGVFTDLFVTIL
ncbi:MAG: type II CAAX endopeptidase family protein [bacterium]